MNLVGNDGLKEMLRRWLVDSLVKTTAYDDHQITTFLGKHQSLGLLRRVVGNMMIWSDDGLGVWIGSLEISDRYLGLFLRC